MTADAEALLEAARAAIARAHAPYSRFRVGAALEDSAGAIHPGVNVESASFSLTICAERNALFGALARGVRSFRRLAIVCDPRARCMPCGACRQALWEHAPDLELLLDAPDGSLERVLLRDLLPRPFQLP